MRGPSLPHGGSPSARSTETCPSGRPLDGRHSEALLARAGRKVGGATIRIRGKRTGKDSEEPSEITLHDRRENTRRRRGRVEESSRTGGNAPNPGRRCFAEGCEPSRSPRRVGRERLSPLNNAQVSQRSSHLHTARTPCHRCIFLRTRPSQLERSPSPRYANASSGRAKRNADRLS